MDGTIKSKPRRDFIGKSTAGLGLVLGTPNLLSAGVKNTPSNALRVGFIGCGKQQRVLFDALINLPGLRYVAAADIMNNRLGHFYGQLRHRVGYKINRYLDAEEMLQKEDLDVVFVATPDFWHADHSNWALESGAHVYCETAMSNTIEGARSMAETTNRTGKLLQISYFRRSHPHYCYAYHELLNKQQLFSKVFRVNSQWYRPLMWHQDIVYGKPKLLPDDATLKKHGFANPHQFLNWRFYHDKSIGLTSELSSAQIDVINWYLQGTPRIVYASGRRNHFKERDSFDSVVSTMEYDTDVASCHAVHNTGASARAELGVYEGFTGQEGTLRMSFREQFIGLFQGCHSDGTERKWQELMQRGYLKQSGPTPAINIDDILDMVCRPSSPVNPFYQLPGTANRTPYAYHIENFLESVRGKETLNCDAQTAYKTEVVLHAIHRSSLENRMIQLEDSDFVLS